MKYSILVPVYNKEELLKKYFKYIESQTFNDYEVVVVDDCSSDNSYSYLCDISRNHDNIKILRNQRNLGLGMTRNILLDNAKGEYVIFVDPDDYIEIDLLNEIDKENNDLDIIRFQNVIEPMTEKQCMIEKDKDRYRYCCDSTSVISGEEALLKWCIGERKINTFPWTYAIKKELYNDIRYPDVRILEDFPITPYLIAKAKRIKAIDFVGYHYKKYDDSMSSNKADISFAVKKLNLLKEMIELTEQYIDMSEISEEAKKIFISDIYNRYFAREKKVESMLKNNASSIERGKKR